MTHQESLKPTPLRTFFYIVGSVIAFGGLVWLTTNGALTPQNSAHGNSANTTTPQASDPVRDRFEQLFELGYRADGNAGNTSVEIVYYFPELRQQLIAYNERSSIQAQTLGVLEKNQDTHTVPFLVMLNSNGSLPRDSVNQGTFQLSVDGATGTFVRFDPLEMPGGTDAMLYGVAWFKVLNSDSVNTLTLNISNFTGNVKPSTLTWDTRVFRLLDESINSSTR